MVTRLSQKLRSFFKLDENKTTVRTEVLAGLTTFITVAYILILNPQILSHPYALMGDTEMVSNVKDVDLSDMEKAMPAFCTIVFMPFTCSIANGIALGLITHCLILLLTGKARQIKPLTVIVSLIFVARYAFMTLG